MLPFTALLLALASFEARAQAVDPLRSPECGAARQLLESAIDDAAARRAGAPERLARVRKQAIEACLGRENGDAVRTGAPDPPIVVAPPVIVSPGPPAPLPAPAPSAEPLAIQRPATLTVCDASGCWDSQGRRLNQHGPVFVGPQGLCTVQAGAVQCP